MEESNISLPPC